MGGQTRGGRTGGGKRAHFAPHTPFGPGRYVPAPSRLCGQVPLGLAEKRAVQRANSAGMTQTDIARSLGISQPTVHRLVRQLQATSDELGERSVREIIAEAVIGTTDRESMMAELTRRNPQPGEFPPDSSDDGFALGEWDEVVDAWETAWLTDDEY